jgi:acetyl esterase/lipase
MADINTIGQALLNAGYAVVCPNHRSIADGKWPAQVNDIKAVIRFIRANADKYKFDTSFIATSGFSSGGHLSAVTALSNNVKIGKYGTAEYDIEGNVGPYTKESSYVNAFCDWSGPTELLQMECGNAMVFGGKGNTPEEQLIGAPKEGNEDKFMLLSATGFLDKDDVAGYMFHGDADFVVASCVSQYLYDKMQEAGVESYIVRVPEGSHGGGAMYTEENLKKMVDFLNAQRAKVSKK